MVENFFSFELTNCSPSITVIYMTTTTAREIAALNRHANALAAVPIAKAAFDAADKLVQLALVHGSPADYAFVLRQRAALLSDLADAEMEAVDAYEDILEVLPPSELQKY